MSVLRTCAVLCALLAGCGGGGGGYGGGGGNGGGNGTTWTPGVFPASSSYDAMCVSPRSGIDPTTGSRYPDVAGTRTDENNWLRSWTNELYLWYSEVPDLNPANYGTPEYFDLMMTSATTPSGNPKDKFHFTYPTDAWVALSQSGQEAGYGATWAVLAARPPRQVVVAFTEPGSPAAGAPANLDRGAEVLFVDGVDLVNAGDQASVDTLNAGLFPAAANETHTFTVRDLGAATTRVVTLQSAIIASTPVQHVSTLPVTGGVVGYILFNDHIATSESLLINAFNTLQAAAVTDLVLDIRYNGGGYLDIASEVAYMIAGAGRTSGQTFEQLQFNDKNPNTDPVTHQPLTPVLFHSQSQGFDVPPGTALPSLNLARVFVLTGPNTCSASESIINSLRGVNVQVIEIGSTTCGKPYGFYPADNCGTTYFSIQFRGVNAMGFGDYTDGFTPQNTVSPPGVLVPGCSIADDFGHSLGDPAEARFAEALAYRSSGACASPPSGLARKAGSGRPMAADGLLSRSPARENRMLRPPSVRM